MQAALDRFTYRPGWRFSLHDHPFEGTWIRIEADVENAYTPGDWTVIGINSPIPPVQSAQEFYYWLIYRLLRVESHECREWFQVDGEAWRDPHDDIERQLGVA